MPCEVFFMLKDAEKIITEISSVQAAILSSKLKEILTRISTHEITEGTCKPIKLVYHPNVPFYFVKHVVDSFATLFSVSLKSGGGHNINMMTMLMNKLLKMGAAVGISYMFWLHYIYFCDVASASTTPMSLQISVPSSVGHQVAGFSVLLLYMWVVLNA
ncbi:actin-related protein 2/3 complex subunit 2B-like isoform X1 [Rutidosis leptorrhynchoides]|uniref:actin-related protein 2/3 complex subunit 2B-like isoform X1 n=1 Tax=Rutidosis leptorrhynchoides TaxID=125765 RepID=UPI003A9A0DE6